MASMAFAETETKVTNTLLLFVHPRHVEVSWQTRCSNNIDAITLESFQMPTPTLELSPARKNVVKSATAECTTALDMPPRRPSLPVCRSYPHAIKSGRFKLCSWSTRKNSWSGPLHPRKTRYDGTWRQDVLTENKHPGRPLGIVVG